jgi:hypothetical protein
MSLYPYSLAHVGFINTFLSQILMGVRSGLYGFFFMPLIAINRNRVIVEFLFRKAAERLDRMKTS